jgi:hypothetical protein
MERDMSDDDEFIRVPCPDNKPGCAVLHKRRRNKDKLRVPTPEAVKETLEVTKIGYGLLIPQELATDIITAGLIAIPVLHRTPEKQAEAEARYAAWRAQREAQLADAVAEWQALRDRYADSPAVLAVLDIHLPVVDGGVVCAHPVYGYEADAEDWPCETYTAIKESDPT